MEGKRLEAVQHLNAAEDALKSSFFKSPDSYTAIKELESAGLNIPLIFILYFKNFNVKIRCFNFLDY
jgi:hypothetical protein